MNAIAIVENTLPGMIQKAAQALAASTDAAEVLEVSGVADVAYTMAKEAARMAKAQAAHDEVVRAAHKVQGDALDIKAAASKRYYEMTQAAIEAGEIPGHGGHRGNQHTGGKVSDQNFANPAQHKAVSHEGKLIAEAEERSPGIVRETIDAVLSEGRAPTKADIKRVINGREDVIERAAAEERAMIDNRDFRALRKLWKSSSPGARDLFKAWLAAE